MKFKYSFNTPQEAEIINMACANNPFFNGCLIPDGSAAFDGCNEAQYAEIKYKLNMLLTDYRCEMEKQTALFMVKNGLITIEQATIKAKQRLNEALEERAQLLEKLNKLVR